MGSAFDDDFASAEALLAEAFGTEVLVTRGVIAATAVTAEVVIRDNLVNDEDTGFQNVVQSRDYLIAVADYQVNGSVVAPRSGDTITETINGATYVFELMPIGKRPAFEWADAGGTKWLVRTKKVT